MVLIMVGFVAVRHLLDMMEYLASISNVKMRRASNE